MINLRDLKAFVVLAEELHFGRAAQRLAMAQPNLSAVIRHLEERLSVKLLTRRPRVELTEAGRVLQTGSLGVLAQIEGVLERARLAGEGQVGAVRVGFASTTMLTALPEQFRSFRAAHAEIDLQLREMHSAAQWEALMAGALDVAITREIQHHRSIRSVSLLREPFVAVLPKRHVALRKPKVPVASLALEPFIVCRRAVAPLLYDQVMAICEQAGFAPRIAQEADEWHTVFGFVRGGFGVSIAPESLERLGWRGVAFRPLSGASLEAELHLCWAPERASPAVEKFVTALVRT